MKTLNIIAAAMILAATSSFASADVIYTQNFDSMGTGTAAPTGWSVYSISGAHTTFTPLDDSDGVLPTSAAIKPGTSSDTVEPTLTVATANDTQKGVVGYNWAVGGSSSNRSLGTSPSGNAATVLQLTMTNNTGAAITDISVAYDVLVQSVTVDNNNYNNAYNNSSTNTGVEELPGYWLWYSLDGNSTFTNVASLDANGHTWANAIGTVHESDSDVTLSSTWAAGASITFLWFDDNAEGPSPDQELGLDNVSIASVPEPTTMAILGFGAAALIRRCRKVA